VELWKKYLAKIQETAELDKKPEWAVKELEAAKCSLPKIQAEIEALKIVARLAIPAKKSGMPYLMFGIMMVGVAAGYYFKG
jgi:ribonucleotide reductase alpha subunit